MSAKDNIENEILRWKSKGMTPSLLQVGPDVEQVLRDELGTVPTEFAGIKVALRTANGFSCIGPWYFTSVKNA